MTVNRGTGERTTLPVEEVLAMRRPVVMSLVALPLLLGVAPACGSSGDETTGSPSTSAAVGNPEPGEMCAPGSSPIMAAYDIDSGAFQWVACAEGGGMFLAVAASADRVWVESPGVTTQQFVLDAATGEVLDAASAGEVPDDADRWTQSAPSADGVEVRGGQDDPLIGVDAATGAVIWRAEGHPNFDDVWAHGDGAVFVQAWDPSGATAGGFVAAYEIVSGAERWRWAPEGSIASAWHVTGTRLFAMGADLWVLDTQDGTVLWHTSYGESATGYPRMFGALANDDSVFLAFTSVPSMGD